MRLGLEVGFLVIFDIVKQLFNIFILLVLTVFSTQQIGANDVFLLTENSCSSVEEISNAGGKIAKTYEDFLNYANDAYKIYSKKLPDAIKQIEGIVGDMGSVTGRAKRSESAANRLQRAVSNGYVKEINSTDKALDNIWDALGTRVVLKNGTPSEVDHIITSLSNSIKKGEIEVVSVNSLTGKDGIPYLTEKHLKQLEDASSSVGKPMKATPKEYDSGYTVGTVFIKYSDNVRGELQIIGNKTLKIANAEHWVYDAFLGKPFQEYLDVFTKTSTKDLARKLIEKIRKPAEKLSDVQRKSYNSYLNSIYKNARKLESGGKVDNIVLPSGIPKELGAESLLKTDELLEGLKSGVTKTEDVLKFLNG